MKPRTKLYSVRVGMVTGIFAVGFFCGSLTGRSANAQFGDVGGELMQKATGSGGIIGSAAEMGTTISDMEKHIDGLQKNLGVLKKIKTALGGR